MLVRYFIPARGLNERIEVEQIDLIFAGSRYLQRRIERARDGWAGSEVWALPDWYWSAQESYTIERALTFVAVAGTSATQWINPLLFSDTEFASEADRRQDAGSGQIDVVEGVHQQRI